MSLLKQLFGNMIMNTNMPTMQHGSGIASTILQSMQYIVGCS